MQVVEAADTAVPPPPPRRRRRRQPVGHPPHEEVVMVFPVVDVHLRRILCRTVRWVVMTMMIIDGWSILLGIPRVTFRMMDSSREFLNGYPGNGKQKFDYERLIR